MILARIALRELSGDEKSLSISSGDTGSDMEFSSSNVALVPSFFAMHNEYSNAGSIGDGTFGSVVKLVSRKNEHLAGKLLSADEEDGTLQVATIVEASILAMITKSRPPVGIISLKEVTILNSQVCLVLPLMPLTLSAVLDRLSQKQKLEISCGLAEALAWLHGQGVMHRDVKSRKKV